MQFDYYSHLYLNSKNFIKNLFDAERNFENARGENNKYERESAQQSIFKNLSQLEVSDPTLFYHYLNILRSKQAGELLNLWKNKILDQNVASNKNSEDLYETLSIFDADTLKCLPAYSLLIRCVIQLIKPYISRDDHDFYIIDNPIKSDKLLRRPLVSATTWKGCFRKSLQSIQGIQEDDIVRLVGQESPQTENAKAGRLSFFPSFFEEKDRKIEIINPHERKNKKGGVPVSIECVRQQAKAIFTLLYVPFDLNGEYKQRKNLIEIQKDLSWLPDALNILWSQQGFGAKTSAGYDLAKLGKGELYFRSPLDEPFIMFKFDGFESTSQEQQGFKQKMERLIKERLTVNGENNHE